MWFIWLVWYFYKAGYLLSDALTELVHTEVCYRCVGPEEES